jgi:hypothetical protein
MDDTALQAAKSNIIRELFFKTADQTYIVARWCFLNRLYLDFYWNGLHAVEKYLKASLLFNDRSAISPTKNGKEYNHNIERLFASVREYAGELIPASLKKPKDLQINYWMPETTVKFVERLNRQGDPSNRYNLFGFAQHPEDLYKFDILIFAIRRLSVNLEANYLNFVPKPGALKFKSNATVLKENPDYQPDRPGSRLSQLIGEKGTDEVKATALTHNLSFAPKDFDHGSLPAYSSSDNPVLYRAIIVYAEQGNLSPEDRQEVITLTNWVIDNIALPGNAKKELHDARDLLGAK